MRGGMRMSRRMRMWGSMGGVSLSLFLISFLALLAVPGSGLSQDPSGETKQALVLENIGDYDGAFELYMKYERGHPGFRAALVGMGRTAKRAERTMEYRRILGERFDEIPSDREIARFYVQSLYKSGEREECLRVGSECVRRWPLAPDIYTSTCMLYRSNGMAREAIEVVLLGRQNLGDDELFRREMAELLMTTGDLPGSVREFLAFYKANERSIAYVGKKLLEAAAEFGDLARVTEAVEREGGGEACSFVLPLLIDLEIAAGEYKGALDRILSCRQRQPDRIAEELSRLARVSLRNGEEGVAARAVEEAIGFAGGAKPKVKIQLAEELGKMGREEDALGLLETLREENISTQDRIKSYELLGDLTLEAKRDPRGAIEWYQKLEAEGVPTEQLADLSLKVARALVEAGDIGAATRELERLEEYPLEGFMRSEIMFELGNAYLYHGRVEEALGKYRKLIERAPGFRAASEAIDALRYEKSFGEEGIRALAAIGRAKYAERCGKGEEARHAYADALKDAGEGALAGEIRLQFAGFLSRSGSAGLALSLYEEVTENSGEDYLAARAFTEMGKLYYFVLKNNEAAREALETVVLRYGDVVETEEARRILAGIKQSS
jgi:tetratricopeptide (TPR) repeat protein